MAVFMSTTEMLLSIEEERVVATLQEIAKGLDGSAGEAVLDFSAVRRIDSSALQALQDLVRVADDKAVTVVLRGVNVDVYKVLKLVKLTERFSFVH
jgi:anti-anti-sigma regulatory factor